MSRDDTGIGINASNNFLLDIHIRITVILSLDVCLPFNTTKWFILTTYFWSDTWNRIFYTKLLWHCIFEILPTSHDIIYTVFSPQFDILINCALTIRASQNLGLRFLITVTRHSFEKATWKENLYFSIINCFQSAVKNPSSEMLQRSS